jgi:putative PEP-CTERM system histidine kinase
MSYGAAGLAFACLAVLMAISWRGAPRGIALIAAVGMTAAWGIVLALGATRDLSVLTTYVVETLADCAWLTALVVLGGPLLKRGLRVLAVAVGATACLAPAILWGLERLEVFYADPATLIQRTQLALSFCGLILLEQIYRNPTPGGRKSTRWFVVGVALLFACDLLLYSHAELRGGMSFEFWSARGLLYVFVAPLIAVSAQRTRDWSVDVFVSRQVVFYSTTVLLSLAYLAVVVVGGYYVRQLGGEWGRVGQLVFLVGAVVALAGILSSATLRRHAAVFLSKHFYRNKYDYRIEWLRFIRTLSSTDEPDVRRTAVRAIAQIFDSPGGLLFLKDSDEPRFVLQAAWPASLELSDKARPVALHDDLAEFLVRRHWIIDLRELRVAPEVYDNISVPDWLMEMPALRLVAPLLQLDEVVGFICLCDPPRPFKLTYEDRDLLKTVGRHVATHIAQDDASRRLAESRQFEAYNRLTAFMMHDLKNSVAQLKLIVDNSVRHKHNPEFVDDAIETIRNAVERISKLIEQLRGRRELERLEEVDLGAIVQQAARRCADRQPRPTVEVTEISRVMANNERLTSVIEHILRNAQDATAENGSINVQVSRTDAGARVTVTDTGTGMEADFVRDRLFRPFDSTKGAKGMGIGAYQAREYIRSLGGTVEVQSTPHVGTSFSFTLPRVEDAQGRSNEPMQARASGPV